MNEERMKILELLSEGKINTEEALELIKNLEATPNSSSQSNGLNFDWLRDLQTNLIDTMQDLSFDVSEDGWFLGLGSRGTVETSICSDNIEQDISSLRLVGKNGSVEVTEGHDRHIVIDASYRTRGEADPRLVLEEDCGSYRLSYDENAVVFMKLNVRVPSVKISSLYAESKNAPVKLSNLKFNKACAVTKNSSVKLNNLEGSSLIAKTKNASVSLQNISAETLDISSTNGKIELEDVTAKSAELQTTNSAIKTVETDIMDIIAKTTNAGVKLSPSMASTGDYIIDAQTTNGSIAVTLSNDRDISYKLKASTTNGRIKTNLSPLNFTVNEKNYVDAKTEHYEQAQSTKHLSMTLSTTNSDIKIGC